MKFCDYPTDVSHQNNNETTINSVSYTHSLLPLQCSWAQCFSLRVLNCCLEMLRALKQLLLLIPAGARFGGR